MLLSAQPTVVAPPFASLQRFVPVAPVNVPAASAFTSPEPCTLVSGVEPLSTKLVLALSVVNAPSFGVVRPMCPGDSQLKPSRKLASRFGTIVELAITNGGVPVGKVLVICPLNVPVVALNPLLKFGVPLKIGEPDHVPDIEPPPPSAFGPSDVKPTLKFTGPLKLLVPCQVLVPVHVLLDDSSDADDGLMPSSVQICVPVEQFVPPGATS